MAVGRVKDKNLRRNKKFLKKRNVYYGYEKLFIILCRLQTSEKMIYTIKTG